MIKVRVLTGMTAAGAAVLSIPSLTGCSADARDDVAGGVQDDTESVAGSGQIMLHGYSLSYQSTSGGDEFVRVGEKLKLTADFNSILMLMWPQDADDQKALADIKADPTKVELTAKVVYTKFDDTKFDASFPMTVAAGPGGVLGATSAELTIAKGMKRVSVDIEAKYQKAGKDTTRSVFQNQGLQRDFVVFGAFVPNKLALFDTAGADKRARIVEGGGLVRGSQVLFSYTDWRADTVVDKTNLDLRIGRRVNYSRFGTSIVDALGSLEYVISAAVSTDGGKTYAPLALAQVAGADVFGVGQSWRSAYQAAKDIAADAGPDVRIAFHVQAFLVVPQYYGSEILEPKYQPGQRVLLKDVWDNHDGADWSLPVGSE